MSLRSSRVLELVLEYITADSPAPEENARNRDACLWQRREGETAFGGNPCCCHQEPALCFDLEQP